MPRTFDGSVDWPALRSRFAGRLDPDTLAALDAAVAFAAERHGDQRRPAGEPYLEHLLEALQVLVDAAGVTDPDTLRAAVLHDVVEDTPTTLDEVRARFGDRVAELVGWVTKTGDRAEYLARLRDAPPAAIDVKLADRLSNVQRLRTHPRPAKRSSYYRETVATIVPLAAGRPFFAEWYTQWQAEHADLAFRIVTLTEPVPGELTEADRRFHRVLRYLRSGAWVIRDPHTFGADPLDPAAPAAVPRGYRTDGDWIWPVALEYHLEHHGVAPPPELLDLMAERGYYSPRVPADRCGQAHQALLPHRPGPFEPPAPMQFRLPPDVYDLLVTVGWAPGRDIGERIDRWAPGLDPQRRAILAEFGGLTYPVYGYGRDWPVMAFHLLPNGPASDPSRIAAAETRLGAPLLPIGSVPQWGAEIVLHPKLGIGTAGDIERYLGADIDEALTSLVRGTAPKRPWSAHHTEQ
ncbi:HD domain-containing protein [Dactylosporangium sp. CA-092794]|uniref:HD domain-containing protein n=1 Tax=Dactylosporangium sp. CA-092794 TaxID=3239929 RepID=UPI003D8F7CA6